MIANLLSCDLYTRTTTLLSWQEFLIWILILKSFLKKNSELTFFFLYKIKYIVEAELLGRGKLRVQAHTDLYFLAVVSERVIYLH